MSVPLTRSAHLLRADEEQLDRAAIGLRSGPAFLVAMCPVELRQAALERLRGRVKGMALPDPSEVGSPEEMLDALVEQVERRDRALSLVLARDIDGALDALNLHREKVLKGTPVILWLEDVAALQKMRERAPDAYSFRSTMMVLRGDGGALPVATAEPEEVAQRRRRLKRARTPLERAAASRNLAESLRMIGRRAEAEDMAIKGLGMLPQNSGESDDALDVQRGLFTTLVATATGRQAWIEALQWLRLAQTAVDRMSFARGLAPRSFLLAIHPGPLNCRDKTAVDEALKLVRTYGLAPEHRTTTLLFASAVARYGGDLRRARALIEDARLLDPHQREFNIALAMRDSGHTEMTAGRFGVAEAKLREAAAVLVEVGGGTAIVFDLIDCSVRQGELASAERFLYDSVFNLAEAHAHPFLLAKAQLAFAKSDADSAIRTLRCALSATITDGRDGDCVDVCEILCSIIEASYEADPIASSDLTVVILELETAQDVLLSLSGSDGPAWYPIRLLTLRAQLLALTPETRPEALTLARQAFDLSRSTYPDLLPETGRALADHFLRATRPDDALALIAEIELEASSRGFLKELARLRAARILALVQQGAPPSAIEPHLAALREALASTDSPRITAETLLDLVIRLPLAATFPDPHVLAEEAHGLFLAMPMPAAEARCLELMGDVLLARGRAPEAKRQYSAARVRLERLGLGLRLPLLTRKIDALP